MSMVHIYGILHSLYIFEEIFFDLVFKCAVIVDGFSSQVQDCSIFCALGKMDTFCLHYSCKMRRLVQT